MTPPALDHLDIASGLEPLISLIRALSPDADLTLTTASTLFRLAGTGPRSVSELAGREGVTQPAMSQLVNRLERLGLAERRGDPTDGRVVRVHITDAGRRKLDERRDHRARRLSTLLALLPPEDERVIAAALPALNRLTELASRAVG